MSKIQKEIECLTQLQNMTSVLDDVLAFLHEEKLIQDILIKDTRTSANYPKAVQVILADLQRQEKLQLLEYFWEILPVERIKITIITDRASREFTFNH